MVSVDDILTEREKTHGSYPRQANISQTLKGFIEIDDAVLLESAHMICHKLARASEGNEREIDHWRDIAGYATLAVRYLEGGG